MARESSTRVAMRIEREMRSAFYAMGSRVFWPQQFVRKNIGDEETVLRALLLIADADKVRLLATLQCPNGHDVWEGPPEKLEMNRPRECKYCTAALDDGDESIYLRAEITPSWRDELEEEASDGIKKKAAGSKRS